MQTDTKLLYVAVVYSIGCCRIVGPLRSALWIPLPAFRRRPQVLTAWSSDLKGYGYLGSVQSRAEVRAIFLNVDKPLAEKSPRPGHSRVTAIHQNTRGLPSFEGYKVPL